MKIYSNTSVQTKILFGSYHNSIYIKRYFNGNIHLKSIFVNTKIKYIEMYKISLLKQILFKVYKTHHKTVVWVKTIHNNCMRTKLYFNSISIIY